MMKSRRFLTSEESNGHFLLNTTLCEMLPLHARKLNAYFKKVLISRKV